MNAKPRVKPFCVCGCGEIVARPERYYVTGHNRRAAVAERFWAKVAMTDTCWLWTGARSDTGYGSFASGGKVHNAHRFAYESLVGPIAAGLQLDHICRVRHCVNPAHLEAVTPAENIRRAVKVGHHGNSPQTCKRGHDWTQIPPFLAHRSDGSITRRCRECQRLMSQRRKGSAA